MASKQSAPEIRSEAFIAAREKCALSVEKLAHLACLSSKQIQQIENGQSSTFYSPAVKFTAAKKVAQLIQLDEKDAFDFGPQAELPFVQGGDIIQSELKSALQEPLLDTKKEAPKNEAAHTALSQADPKPILVELPTPESRKRAYFDVREHKSTGNKWVWLLPVGALAFALVQFQPLLEGQLDALMGKAKPVEETALTVAPVDATPTSPPVEPASATPATTSLANPPMAVAANLACPVPDESIENYKSPSASKPGNMVFVKMPTAQIICVEDGDGNVQSRAMEPGFGHSFYGKAPFKLLTSGLSSAEIFFQGYRVRPSNADSKSILLVQVD
jgi:DNA-binding XRE family transcriptional regulator